jgi:hypothetical protein
MNREELDTLWFQAMRQSIEEGEDFIRYHFAALVAEREREACAKVCEKQIKSYMSKQYTTDPLGGFRERFAAEQCAAAIRARGEV